MTKRPPDPPRRPSRRSGNPAVRAGTAPQTPARAELERRSLRPLTRLAAAPRWSMVVGTLALVVAGLLLPGRAGALALLVVAALVGWLLALTWPVLRPAGRVTRTLLLVLVLAYAASKLVA